MTYFMESSFHNPMKFYNPLKWIKKDGLWQTCFYETS